MENMTDESARTRNIFVAVVAICSAEIIWSRSMTFKVEIFRSCSQLTNVNREIHRS